MASRDEDHTSSFLRDGYCICRGFLSPSDLAVLRRESDALLARAASSTSSTASPPCTSAPWDVLQDGCVLDLFSERQVPIDARREPGLYLKARQQRSRDARARGGGAGEDKRKEEAGDEAEKKEVAVAGIIAGIVGRALPSRAYGLLRAWREQQGGIKDEDGEDDDGGSGGSGGGSGGGRAATTAVAERGLGWAGETKGGAGTGGNGAGGSGTGTAGGTLVARGTKRRRTDCRGSAGSSETGSSEVASQHPPQSQQQGARGDEGTASGGRGSIGKGKVVYLFNEHHVVKVREVTVYSRLSDVRHTLRTTLTETLQS